MFRNRKKSNQNDWTALSAPTAEPWKTQYHDTATLEDVYYCFRLLLGRNPSAQDWHAHSTLAGGRLKDVVASYLDSPEFKSRQLSSFQLSDIELVDLAGFRMYIPKNDPQVGKHLYYWKTYQPPIANLLKANLKPGDYFVDVGANIGYFSMLAASLVGDTGRVFSFEPFAQNVKLLHLSQHANHFAQVEIFPLAAGSGRALYLYDNSGSNGFISPLSSDFRAVMESTITYSMRLDELLKNVERIDFLKIDVEGAEYLVLQGADSLLHAHRPSIIAEFNPAAINAVSHVAPLDYLRALQIDVDYEFFILAETGAIACQQNIEKITEWLEKSGSYLIDVLVTPRPLNFTQPH